VGDYRTRGLVFVGARDYYDAVVPGGAAAVAQQLDRETAAFFEQIFLGSAMYDIMPILKISAVAARIAGTAHMDFVRANAIWLAEHDLTGVYKLFVRALPPDAVALRLPKLALKYFDFGEAETRKQGERCCIGEMRGIPAALVPWIDACVQGYVRTALTIAGAKNARARLLETEPNGHGRDNALSTLKFELRWS
jgi:hypothetical protein